MRCAQSKRRGDAGGRQRRLSERLAGDGNKGGRAREQEGDKVGNGGAGELARECGWW
jgi:hypothetical protein